jgi:hypothetical protein
MVGGVGGASDALGWFGFGFIIVLENLETNCAEELFGHKGAACAVQPEPRTPITG